MPRPDDPAEFQNLRLRAGLSRAETAGLLGVSARSVLRYENGQSRASAIAVKWLQEQLRVPEKRRKPATFRFIDLFAGIGGMRLGFEAIGGQCVFTSEWDKWSQQTYRRNFPDDEQHVFAGDVRPYGANPERIPDFDVLLAGFPCQPFSLAGVSKKNSLGRK